MVSYCVILKMAVNKKDLHRTSGTSDIYDKLPVSIHDEAKMDIDLAKYLLLLSFYRQ